MPIADRSTRPTNVSPTTLSPTALICTMGGKPQLATFALDVLLAHGVAISRVFLLHLSMTDPRIKRSVEMIRKEFAAGNAKRAMTIESRPIQPTRRIASDGLHPELGPAIERIDDPLAADAVWMTMHALIGRLKVEGYAIHLCVAGGPRLMALQALSAASLMLHDGDRCWHLFTPKDIRDAAGEGDLMHTNDTRVRMVPVPLLPLGNLAPVLRRMAFATPEDVIATGRRAVDAEHVARCARVWEHLTGRERETLRVFAIGARSKREAAKKLGVAVSTVNTYTSNIYDLCRAEWNEPPDTHLNFHDLHERFGPLPESFWA
jgi:CRISPR-associated protein Csx14